MNQLMLKVKENPTKTRYVGLRTATAEEISKIKVFLKAGEVPFKHKIYKRDGTRLPFNGVLQINPRS